MDKHLPIILQDSFPAVADCTGAGLLCSCLCRETGKSPDNWKLSDVGVLTGMYLGKIEEKIAMHSELMISTYKAEDFNDILRYNYVSFGMPGYSKEKEELYHWVYNELICKGEEIVPMAGYWEDDLWYQAISDQRYYGWGQSDPDHTDYFNHLNESGANYILVLKDSQIYADEQAYFDSLERIYDTGIGFVARKELYE